MLELDVTENTIRGMLEESDILSSIAFEEHWSNHFIRRNKVYSESDVFIFLNIQKQNGELVGIAYFSTDASAIYKMFVSDSEKRVKYYPIIAKQFNNGFSDIGNQSDLPD